MGLGGVVLCAGAIVFAPLLAKGMTCDNYDSADVCDARNDGGCPCKWDGRACRMTTDDCGGFGVTATNGCERQSQESCSAYVDSDPYCFCDWMDGLCRMACQSGPPPPEPTPTPAPPTTDAYGCGNHVSEGECTEHSRTVPDPHCSCLWGSGQCLAACEDRPPAQQPCISVSKVILDDLKLRGFSAVTCEQHRRQRRLRGLGSGPPCRRHSSKAVSTKKNLLQEARKRSNMPWIPKMPKTKALPLAEYHV